MGGIFLTPRPHPAQAPGLQSGCPQVPQERKKEAAHFCASPPEFHGQVQVPKPSRAGWHRPPPGGRCPLWVKSLEEIFWAVHSTCSARNRGSRCENPGTHFTGPIQEQSRTFPSWRESHPPFHRLATPPQFSQGKVNSLAQPHLRSEKKREPIISWVKPPLTFQDTSPPGSTTSLQSV